MRENKNDQIEEVVLRIQKNYLVEIDDAFNIQLHEPVKLTIPCRRVFTVFEDELYWEISTNNVLLRFARNYDAIEIIHF